ncbi:XapX domain-containing protein [Exiguobacterium flavidum]|uniref:XapX domain-containing protein n=1 Tax=Exiguobacterium flavidum TaxID=2184695 RepID=UPI000DF816D0|nr:DUF1427 family protein [Exiguobacterium flavidum]
MVQQILLSLLAGVICGVVFTALKLPIPAPPVFPAIVGIFGVFLGMKIFLYATEHWPF